MGDEADQAQDYQARHNAEAVAQALRVAQRPSADNVTQCVECGDSIPRARRKALPGVRRCTECQRDYERHKRGV